MNNLIAINPEYVQRFAKPTMMRHVPFDDYFEHEGQLYVSHGIKSYPQALCCATNIITGQEIDIFCITIVNHFTWQIPKP